MDEEEEEADGHIQERRYKTVQAMRLTLTAPTVMLMASTCSSLRATGPMKVLERGREPCLSDERRGGAMSDLALALAFVAAVALAIAAIYVAATS